MVVLPLILSERAKNDCAPNIPCFFFLNFPLKKSVKGGCLNVPPSKRVFCLIKHDFVAFSGQHLKNPIFQFFNYLVGDIKLT